MYVCLVSSRFPTLIFWEWLIISRAACYPYNVSCLKKSMNASSQREKMAKCLGGTIGCIYSTRSSRTLFLESILLILDIRLYLSVNMRTHQPRSHRQGEGHTGILPLFSGGCLNLLSREGFSRPFPSFAVKSNCWVLHERKTRSTIGGGAGM